MRAALWLAPILLALPVMPVLAQTTPEAPAAAPAPVAPQPSAPETPAAPVDAAPAPVAPSSGTPTPPAPTNPAPPTTQNAPAPSAVPSAPAPTTTAAPPPVVPSTVQPATVPPAASPPAAPPTNPGTPATVLDTQDYDAILGKNVRSMAGEDMGRIIDVVVDRDGRPRAAIIDFGGFLGVGSRKIAVDWRAMHFNGEGKPGRAVLQLTRNQVRVSPEYKAGEPIVVLGPASPEGADQARAAAPEK